MKNGADLIREERNRQIEKEGWTAEHDDKEHYKGQLIRAAICYAANKDNNMEMFHRKIVLLSEHVGGSISITDPWPWAGWDKRKKHSRLRSLVIAGAMIAAEIDRLMRAGMRR